MGWPTVVDNPDARALDPDSDGTQTRLSALSARDSPTFPIDIFYRGVVRDLDDDVLP